jgi:hypothetical protein
MIPSPYLAEATFIFSMVTRSVEGRTVGASEAGKLLAKLSWIQIEVATGPVYFDYGSIDYKF